MGFLQKRGKRRWIFRKQPNQQETIIQHCQARTITTTATATSTTTAVTKPVSLEAASDEVDHHHHNQRSHALAVAMATTAAAKAAVVTAQAAVEVVRLSTRPSIYFKDHLAAITIQTAFRGYLVIILGHETI